jgi:hypothetical protein
MTTMIVRHTVKDFDTWKPFFEEHGSVRDEYGVATVGVYRDTKTPNDVVIILRTDDIDRAQELLASSNLKEVMQSSGVISEPQVSILEEA